MRWSKLGQRRKIQELWKIFDLTNRVLEILVDTTQQDEEWRRQFGFDFHIDIRPSIDEPEMLRYIGKYKKPSYRAKYNKWLDWYSKG